MQALQKLLQRGTRLVMDTPLDSLSQGLSQASRSQPHEASLAGCSPVLALPGQRHHWDPFRAQYLRISEAPSPPLPSAEPCLLTR